MASLEKLAIRGIRSFDDKSISVIEFFTPVTVIVGHNGSGKTTIIECLKYATTGDQPPNTRGGAFVHDPKMAQEKEVKAQVKLRFVAANSTRMLAIRNLSVTMKKTSGLTMKTLESVLALADQKDKSGKRGAISTKCAEMDAEIPQLLGVSKSVLENVIFCHQEESYWPLAEPSALKKKFDDIFEATRYTKALDSIKNLRKERIAELKAEKERLETLRVHKSHADRLKEKMASTNSLITEKELKYEEAKKAYESLVESNRQFYKQATTFREKYITLQQWQENIKNLNAQLEEVQMTMKELPGGEEELENKLKNHNNEIAALKEKESKADSKRQDLEDALETARRDQLQLVSKKGQLEGEAKAQQNRIEERESLIRDLATKYKFKGYDVKPLEREKVIEFISQLGDLQKSYKSDYEQLQTEMKSRRADYDKKLRELDANAYELNSQRKLLREQLSQRSTSISSAETKLDSLQDLAFKQKTLNSNMKEKKALLANAQSEMNGLNYDTAMAEKMAKSRELELRREELNREITSLSLQADSRARFDLKRREKQNKQTEMSNLLEAAAQRFEELIGKKPRAETMERDMTSIKLEKDQEYATCDSQHNAAELALQQAEAGLSEKQSLLVVKKDELRKHTKRIKDGLKDNDFTTVEAAIADAEEQLSSYTSEKASRSGTRELHAALLKSGQEKRVCGTCTRPLSEHDLPAFEKHLETEIQKASPKAMKDLEEDIQAWTEEVARLRKLSPYQLQVENLNKEIAKLEDDVKEKKEAIPDLQSKSEQTGEALSKLKRELKVIDSLTQTAMSISRLRGDISQLENEVSALEHDLASTGSTKTVDDVQIELDNISTSIRANDREKTSLTNDRDRLMQTLRRAEADIHSLEITDKDLANQVREKESLEQSVVSMKNENVEAATKLKDIDSRIVEAQAPIERLKEEFQKIEAGWNAKNSSSQAAYQELSMNVDKLSGMNKTVERYVRDKGAKRLQECNEQIEQHEEQVAELTKSIEAARATVENINKQIHEGGASLANLRDNLRARRLIREIADLRTKIQENDIDAASKALRTFEEKFKAEKEKEVAAQSEWAHLGGEISSHKQQVKDWEVEFKEYKDIYKRYTNQLITVKMSDMANNDLEKYAKALENAIMKYHTLKMEEVNQTMRHLWSKTYQGSDIDGIKIRSDVEGGASKRSYNYRVVMVKNQVEMDMRGRCSAGQKMLASIIIRLALSDSFGQNCGILALDEPTNALDVENIDALAASLVDIINERKEQSNFQLIIITHDENFLKKLGQNNVMDYYWRVSRDSRQKSVIERQRFR